MKTKKKSGKSLRKSGKSQGKIREFDGIKKVGTLQKALQYDSNRPLANHMGVCGASGSLTRLDLYQ